jgi:hypothetical protein
MAVYQVVKSVKFPPEMLQKTKAVCLKKYETEKGIAGHTKLDLLQ